MMRLCRQLLIQDLIAVVGNEITLIIEIYLPVSNASGGLHCHEPVLVPCGVMIQVYPQLIQDILIAESFPIRHIDSAQRPARQLRGNAAVHEGKTACETRLKMRMMHILSSKGCHPEDGLSVQVHADVHLESSTVHQAGHQLLLWLLHMARGPELLPRDSDLPNRGLNPPQEAGEAGLAAVHKLIQVDVDHPGGQIVEGLEQQVVTVDHADGGVVVLAHVHHERDQPLVDVGLQHRVRGVAAAVVYQEEVLHPLRKIVVQLQTHIPTSPFVHMNQ